MRKALDRLVFIDETSLKTNMVKTTGWAPVGDRLVDHAPFGRWRTQTFIAALRRDRIDAPWVIDGAINRATFDRYVETSSPRRSAAAMSSSSTTYPATRARRQPRAFAASARGSSSCRRTVPT